MQAVHRISAAAAGAGVTTGMGLPRTEDVPKWQAAGASLFVLKSDQESCSTAQSRSIR